MQQVKGSITATVLPIFVIFCATNFDASTKWRHNVIMTSYVDYAQPKRAEARMTHTELGDVYCRYLRDCHPGRRPLIGYWEWRLWLASYRWALITYNPRANPQKRRSKTDLTVALHISPGRTVALHISPGHAHQPITGLRPGYVIPNSQSAATVQGDSTM